MWRYYWDKRANVDDYKQFSISFLVKYGHLKTGIVSSSGNISWSRNGIKTGNISFCVCKDNASRTGYVRVQFIVTKSLTGEKQGFDYKIDIVGTLCNYGGLRWWFLDPCDPEETRCSILYLQENGSFAGRKLLNLAYDSQSEPKNPFWKTQIASMRASLLSETIKYRFRNGRLTRKARRVEKYLQNQN